MRVQITNGMFMVLIVNMIYAKAIGVTQSMMVGEAGSAIWLSTSFATLQGLAIMFVTVLAARHAPRRDVMDQASHLLGSWAGKLLGIVFFVFFLGAYGGFMVTFVYHLMDYFLPDTPTYIFILAALIVGLFGAYHGIEVMGRMAYVGIAAIIALNILIMIGSVFDLDIRNIMPLFEGRGAPDRARQQAQRYRLGRGDHDGGDHPADREASGSMGVFRLRRHFVRVGIHRHLADIGERRIVRGGRAAIFRSLHAAGEKRPSGLLHTAIRNDHGRLLLHIVADPNHDGVVLRRPFAFENVRAQRLPPNAHSRGARVGRERILDGRRPYARPFVNA